MHLSATGISVVCNLDASVHGVDPKYKRIFAQDTFGCRGPHAVQIYCSEYFSLPERPVVEMHVPNKTDCRADTTGSWAKGIISANISTQSCSGPELQ